MFCLSLKDPTMTLDQIKKSASDCRTTSRWAEVRSDFDPTSFTAYRIVGIGSKHVRVMSGAGTIFNVQPADVRRAW